MTVVLLWVAALALTSWLITVDLRQHEFAKAHTKARIARLLYSPIQHTLGRLSPDVQFIGTSLSLAEQGTLLVDQAQVYIHAVVINEAAAADAAQRIRQQLPDLEAAITNWVSEYPHADLIRPLLIKQLPPQLPLTLLAEPDVLNATVRQTISALELLMTGNHRLVVLLQNSDELRATGGFMGSYAVIELNEGVIHQLHVQDIYVPDGQFTGFVTAPPGAAEYLSSGKGLRLPDSNWYPDFPTSAQSVMQFFALGKETQIKTIVAINVEVVEELLKITGPIYLRDYDQTVTSENLAELARADRDTFFPGSQQKRQFLQTLLIQLKLRLPELIQQRPSDFVQLFSRLAAIKHIQGYSHEPELQSLFDQLRLTGLVYSHNADRYMYLVESNVGINKANSLVQRQVNLSLSQQFTTVKVEFDNRNQKVATTSAQDRNDYINYQRLLLPKNYKVHQLLVNSNALSSWDEQLITTSIGEQLKQIGFLVAVEAQKTATVEAQLTHPPLPISTVRIQKQPGLPPTPYKIITADHVFDLLLEHDVTLNLEP